MSTQRVAIFDFDGTLADIEPFIMKLYGEVAVEKGWPPLTDHDYKRLREGSVADAIKWVGVRPWQVPGLLREGRARVYELRDEIELFKGIPELLAALRQDGWELYVLSANSTKTIKYVLEQKGLDGYVTVLRRPAIFGKAMSIKNLMRRKGYRAESVWMIGDEVRDIEAAKKAGIKSIAVTWGLQDRTILEQNQPTALATTIKDIAQILKNGMITKESKE